jgi:hypothetical protein
MGGGERARWPVKRRRSLSALPPAAHSTVFLGLQKASLSWVIAEVSRLTGSSTMSAMPGVTRKRRMRRWRLVNHSACLQRAKRGKGRVQRGQVQSARGGRAAAAGRSQKNLDAAGCAHAPVDLLGAGRGVDLRGELGAAGAGVWMGMQQPRRSGGARGQFKVQAGSRRTPASRAPPGTAGDAGGGWCRRRRSPRPSACGTARRTLGCS